MDSDFDAVEVEDWMVDYNERIGRPSRTRTKREEKRREREAADQLLREISSEILHSSSAGPKLDPRKLHDDPRAYRRALKHGFEQKKRKMVERGLLRDATQDPPPYGNYHNAEACIDPVSRGLLAFSELPSVAEAASAVKSAFAFAWQRYKEGAWGFDELKPLRRTNPGEDTFGGQGATIIDSLDGLLMMDMRAEFDEAMRWITTSLNFDTVGKVSVFETNIRILGGLLSAFEMSGEEILLKKAIDLGNRLLYAFDMDSGLVHTEIDMSDMDTVSAKPWIHLAECGTFLLEFQTLSDLTGDDKFSAAAKNVVDVLRTTRFGEGFYPMYINSELKGNIFDKTLLGGGADSFYEYLLKIWLLGGKSDRVSSYFEHWVEQMNIMIRKTLYVSKDRFWYFGERIRGRPYPKFEHLTCFVPGMLILGVEMGKHMPAMDVATRNWYVEIAENVAYTCYSMYMNTASGLSPEFIVFDPTMKFPPNGLHYLLRPEAIESFFLLYRFTKDEKYRRWGWTLFQNIERECKTQFGYCGLRNVSTTKSESASSASRDREMFYDNITPSYFYAETLKYLWLLFSPDETLSLTDWVLNTEAHPFRVRPK